MPLQFAIIKSLACEREQCYIWVVPYIGNCDFKGASNYGLWLLWMFYIDTRGVPIWVLSHVPMSDIDSTKNTNNQYTPVVYRYFYCYQTKSDCPSTTCKAILHAYSGSGLGFYYAIQTITVRKKTLAVKNFGKFGESIVIRQSFFRQSFWLFIGPLCESRSAMMKASVCGNFFLETFKRVTECRLFCVILLKGHRCATPPYRLRSRAT